MAMLSEYLLTAGRVCAALISEAAARVVPSPAGSSYVVERQEPYGTTLPAGG